MSTTNRILVVGLGSPHGDDQAGWIAIDRLETKSLPGVRLVRLAVPHDLLDRLDDIDILYIIDASDNGDCQLANKIARFEAKPIGEEAMLCWYASDRQSDEDLEVNLTRPTGLRSAGSHQIDILTVVDLANSLKRLPRHVTLWTIPGIRFGAASEVSQGCETRIDHCVEAIIAELQLITG